MRRVFGGFVHGLSITDETRTIAAAGKWIDNLAIDARGNLDTAELGSGRRAQKLELMNR